MIFELDLLRPCHFYKVNPHKIPGSESPFHKGELAIQTPLGVKENSPT